MEKDLETIQYSVICAAILKKVHASATDVVVCFCSPRSSAIGIRHISCKRSDRRRDRTPWSSDLQTTRHWQIVRSSLP